MTEYAIRAEGLGKQYRIGGPRVRYRTMRDTLVESVQAPFRRARALLQGQAYGAAGLQEVIWALRDVSFEVKQGEVIGLIGRNGAGKSTLLKILSRITAPTEGYIEGFGRVGSLLEVGTGFHPELTGRENVYLNGAILGMSRREIDDKLDEIVSFAEVEKFIDTPVKHYSSGMYLRLAFAVAAHLEPEILLVDEVLAVGDAAFQKKCLGRMNDVARAGRTVVFVSHNMAAISNLCNRCLLLDGGQVILNGDTATVVGQYLSTVHDRASIDLAERKDRTGDGRFRFQKIWMTDETGEPISSVASGGEMSFVLEYKAASGETLSNVKTAINVRDLHGQVLFDLGTHFTDNDFDSLAGQGQLRCHVPSLPLIADTYIVSLWASANNIDSDFIENAFQFTVTRSDFYGTGVYPVKPKHGTFLVPHSWEKLC
jgi:lipopolysaccharide transport system ATP-binding protein